jgi:trans-aconitate 2-methyltransferase
MKYLAMTDAWNPTQYEKFKKERTQPFYDLLNLCEERKSMQVIDLGCGTGELTSLLHSKLNAQKTLGIDLSQNMLE